MKRIRITIFLGALSSIWLLSACGEKTPIQSSVSDDGEHFVAKVTVQAPSFARSEATQDLWNREISLSIPLHLEAETADGHGDGEDHSEVGGDHAGEMDHQDDEMDHLDDEVAAEELVSFERVVDGMRIEFGIRHAEHMTTWSEGAWVEHHAEPEERHIRLVLEDVNVDAHVSKILYSDVSIAVEKDGVEVDSGTMHPMYGEHGFLYGGNLKLTEAGDYRVTVTAGTPTFARSEVTEGQWMQPTSVTFDYSFAGSPLADEIEIGEAESQGLRIKLDAEGPERMWMHSEDGDWHWLDPAADATHYFRVKLEDPTVEAHAEMIGYAEVHVTIINDDTGEQTDEIELYPMYGDHGLHYGANFHLPDGQDVHNDDDDHHE